MIRDDLTTVYWGEELHGALGNGAESEESIGDGEDSDGYSFGDEEFTSELGDALIPVDFGTGLTAKSISCDKDHTCVILSDDTTMCWGSGKYGVLGYGNTNNIDDSANEMGDNLPAVNLGTGARCGKPSAQRMSTSPPTRAPTGRQTKTPATTPVDQTRRVI